jgi:nicotinate phosphoribosyltransferase
MALFETVSDDTIKRGECTDIYFVRTEETLNNENINPVVSMEVTASALPDTWAVFCGLSDVILLLEGLPVTVDAMPEGTLFYKNEPVVRISGKYRDFCRYETAILGFLCHASGVASAAAHITLAAQGRPVYSFGSRRQHPAIAGMIERAAWIGGADGVSNTCAPKGMPVVGTMPHAFVMCYEKPDDAECGATAVRLDTPRSRRGNMRSIIEEVRWELDAHGYSGVKIFLSGGVTRDDVVAYRDVVDAFGVGGAIANAPVIDFGLDIVEIDGKPKAKRGKRSGKKQVYALQDGGHRLLPAAQEAPDGAVPLVKRFIEDGRIILRSDMQEARERVLDGLTSRGIR